MTRGQKASLVVLAVLLGTLVGLQIYIQVTQPGPGDPCREHVDCRPEGQCLRISSYRPLPVDPQGDPVTRITNQLVNDVMDPLGPNKELSREAKTDDGYCTVPCTTDEDCPKAMRCGEALSFEPVEFLGPDWIDGKGKPVKLCVKR